MLHQKGESVERRSVSLDPQQVERVYSFDHVEEFEYRLIMRPVVCNVVHEHLRGLPDRDVIFAGKHDAEAAADSETAVHIDEVGNVASLGNLLPSSPDVIRPKNLVRRPTRIVAWVAQRRDGADIPVHKAEFAIADSLNNFRVLPQRVDPGRVRLDGDHYLDPLPDC